MIAKKNKKVKSTIIDLKRKLAIVGLAFLFIVLLNANIRIWQEKQKAQKELAKVEESIEKTTKQRENYDFQLGKSNSEEYLEKVAREDLGLQKPGEQVIVIKKQEDSQNTENTGNIGFMQKIFNWFKGLLPE
jgi:cell division protein FtsB